MALIGVSSGRGGHDHRSAMGPRALLAAGLQEWLRAAGAEATWEEIRSGRADPSHAPALDVVADIAGRLGEATRRAVAAGALPVVLGGDHSCAIGTWSGVHAARADNGPLGLIWIDAHMDSHVPATSPSGNLHGMPVAHLLGHGAPELTRLADPGPALTPGNVVLIGVRSFEPEEAALLARLGVRVHLMDEVRRRGFAGVFREAVARLEATAAGYGISVDLDAIDPADAPGTGSPVGDGIRAAELISAVRSLAARPGLVGFEIAEFNPLLDRDGLTVRVVRDLLRALLDGAPEDPDRSG